MENMIKQARQARGYTQRELGERIGVSAITVSNWESGKRELRSSALCLLADVLDVSTDQLLGRKPLISK